MVLYDNKEYKKYEPWIAHPSKMKFNYKKKLENYDKLCKKCSPTSSGDYEEYKDYSIVCKSSYLDLSLLSLILLFL